MEMKALSEFRTKERRGNRPTAVILTAISVETKAVLAHLTDRFALIGGHGTYYEGGAFPNNGSPWWVIVAEGGAGNQAAGNHVIYANQDFSDLDAMIFAGVAGSLKNEVGIGDVVVANQAYSYHSGKSAAEFEPRPRIGLPVYPLVQRVRKVIRDRSWDARIIKPKELESGQEYPCTLPPNAFLAPVASGEQVITDIDSTTCQLIKKDYPDAHAVEMEGYGMLYAASNERTPSIVIRGISDIVGQGKNPPSDAINQPVAAAHAAAFAFELLSIHSQLIEVSPPRITPVTPTDDEKKIEEDILAKKSLDELTNRFLSASSTLLNWDKTLPTNEWLERPELHTLASKIAESEYSATILLGAPGSGKSALLSALASDLVESKHAVLALKADILPPELDGHAALGEFLGLPSDPGTCIHYLCQDRPVVLIVDQLDALASVIDLRTGRLNILLNLIRQLGQRTNIHIIASSRQFEFDHDVRFRALNAETISLDLPAWSQIEPILSKRGVSSEKWSVGFRELLRSPQSLRIFLELLEGTQEAEIFDTYQAMLDKLWEIRVLDSHGSVNRARLLNEMAQAMAAEESLWQPLARYESSLNEIKQLEAAAILTRSGKDRLIGFSHQTLFEHTLARAFARGDNTFSQYVLDRKNTLSVRPKVWTTLTYLRATNFKTYETEFQKIWSDPGLRKHLRYLLAEFLSLQPDPTEDEERWLTPYLQRDEFFGRIFRTMAGSRGWFERLSGKLIPQIMKSEPEIAFNLVPLLQSSLKFSAIKTINLIDEHWVPNKKYDNLSWLVLETTKDWTDKFIDWLATILRRTVVYDVFIVELAKKIGENSPDLAPKIILPALELAYENAEVVSRQLIEKRATSRAIDTGEMEFFSEYINDPRDPYRRILENETEWYDLAEVAEGASQHFLEVLWPWYLRIFEVIAREDSGDRIEYRGDSSLATDLVSTRSEGRQRNDPPLIEALLSAVETFARTAPEHYLTWLNRWADVDLMAVQRILARGLAQIAETKPKEVLGFLLADNRRYALGGMEDRYSDTKLLINKITPHLDSEDCNRLIFAALKYRRLDETDSDASGEERKDRRDSNRRTRLRLLRAFPTDRLPPKIQNLLREEERALYSPPDWDTRISEARYVGSPMGHEAMVLAKDKDILKILTEIEDSSEWDHPKDWRKGGSIQLSREFGEFAKKEPERAIRIIKELKPGRQERPVAHAIESLTEANYPIEELFSLIFELTDRGFSGEDFRYHAANAIGKVVRKSGTDNPRLLALLESWLSDALADDSEDREEKHEDRFDSVLWGYQRISVLPHGNYPTMETLALAYLSRKPMAVDQWLEVLRRHLKRKESPRVWIALTRFLIYLANGDRIEGRSFLKQLFQKYPEILTCVEGAIFLAHIHTWFGERNLQSALKQLRNARLDIIKQAYGEILCLHVAMYPESKWASDQLARLLRKQDQLNQSESAALLGVAFSAAHLWNNAEYRDFATTMLLKIIPLANESRSKAVLDAFRTTEQLQPDGPTGVLLNCICENRHILRVADNSFLIERLPDILPEYPELVHRVCMEITDLHATELRNLGVRISGSAGELVDIALTLHRMGGENSERGLSLFERLLEINAYGAQETLMNLDNRIARTEVVRRRSHRRRRRR